MCGQLVSSIGLCLTRFIVMDALCRLFSIFIISMCVCIAFSLFLSRSLFSLYLSLCVSLTLTHSHSPCLFLSVCITHSQHTLSRFSLSLSLCVALTHSHTLSRSRFLSLCMDTCLSFSQLHMTEVDFAYRFQSLELTSSCLPVIVLFVLLHASRFVYILAMSLCFCICLNTCSCVCVSLPFLFVFFLIPIVFPFLPSRRSCSQTSSTPLPMNTGLPSPFARTHDESLVQLVGHLVADQIDECGVL